MQLERLAIQLRPRRPWAAIDLGFRMAATWWRPLWGVWLLVYVPLGLALCVALPGQPLAAALLMWWLKPLFDRFVLHGLGEAVFGGAPGVASTLSAWRAILGPGLFAALTWRRFGMSRSFVLPVTLLERQTGAAAAARRRVLGRRLAGHAVWLTLVCMHFEAVVHLGASFLVNVLLAPGEEPIGAIVSAEFDPDAPWWTLQDTLLYLLSVSLIEPFYVAGGFALYLNRRVLLEGWDVELSLRRLAARWSAAAGLGRAALLALALACSLATPLPVRAQAAPAADPCAAAAPAGRPPPLARVADGKADAQSRPKSTASRAEAEREAAGTALAQAPLDTPARRAIVAVLEDPLFGRCERNAHWEFRLGGDEEADAVEGDPEAFADFIDLLAELWQLVMWIALAVGVVVIAVFVARQWAARGRGDATAEAPPTVLFGLAIAPDSLPPDIGASALALLAAGQAREALSLVYRGALSRLVHARGLRVARGATEGEVAQAARPRLVEDGAAWFERLLAQWIAVAYAGRAADVDAVRALCLDFERHFGTAAAAPAAAAQAAP